MKTCWFYCCCILSLVSGSCLSAKDNYLEYHKQIINAEERFIKNDISGSLAIYKTMFEQYRPFARDCFIALQLSVMTGDSEQILFFFNKGVAAGLTMDIIQISPVISDRFDKKPEERKNLERIFKEARKAYLKSLDLQLRAEIMVLVQTDDVYHNLWRHKRISDSLYTSILIRNTQKLTELVQMRGSLPGEHIIGISDSDLDPGKSSIDYKLDPVYALLFYHNGCSFASLKKELMDAITSGELHPRIYAYFMDWAYTDLDGRTGTNLARFYRHLCKLDPRTKYYNIGLNALAFKKDTAMVNRCRAEIGIASLAHDQAKEAFARKHKLFLFFGFSAWPEQYKGNL